MPPPHHPRNQGIMQSSWWFLFHPFMRPYIVPFENFGIVRRSTLRIPMNELTHNFAKGWIWGSRTCPPHSSGYRTCKAKNKGTWHGRNLQGNLDGTTQDLKIWFCDVLPGVNMKEHTSETCSTSSWWLNQPIVKVDHFPKDQGKN